jgi:DNA-binding MarR family transcriptional regulator
MPEELNVDRADPRAAARKFDAALAAIRKVDLEMPAQYIAGLLYVWAHPGTTQVAIAEHLNMSDAAVSRMTARFSERQTVGKKGLNLVVNEVNPTNQRERQLYLTPRGTRLVQEILTSIG